MSSGGRTKKTIAVFRQTYQGEISAALQRAGRRCSWLWLLVGKGLCNAVYCHTEMDYINEVSEEFDPATRAALERARSIQSATTPP